jgi:nitrogen-specific signal transduction histidine kinase/DNA-binding NarL/FixJ family response regulator
MQAPCVLLARDDDVARRVTGQLHSCAQVTRIESGPGVLAECRKHDPMLLIMEVGWREALEACREVRRQYPDTLVIALGVMRSDPMIEAATLGVYACEALDVDRLRLQDLVRHAFAHLALLEENRVLRDSPPASPEPAPAPRPQTRETATKPLGPLTQVFRNFHDVEGMLHGVIETAASTAGVSRAGIFAQARPESAFVLRAGQRCLPDTETLTVASDDDFVRWMHEHAHVAARMTLPHIEPPATRTMIKRWLDVLGAEVILPLHGHNRLIGWLFVGHLASGIPFDHDSLNHLIAVSHDVAVVLENGLLSEEAAIQKTLAETVLGSIPAGIVAINSGGSVQWFNESAGRMLGLEPGNVIGQSPALLGSRLADMLIRATRGEIAEDPVKWTDPITHLPLSVVTRTLSDGDTSLGAVAILHDLSRERLLREKQERIDRATFWTELAAAISHEVRNPLVAISTFAQLLPERHEDPEFREQFSQLAVGEISRLNAMIDQVNDFANPPELCFRDVDLADAITQGVKQAKEHLNSGIPVRVTADPSLPAVRGDIAALIECFQHIVSNSIEALHETADPSILIVATGGDKAAAGQVTVRIQDNGPGIPPSIVDKIFSPFCTMKARGIGLGLPIAKRTITDHNGHIDIETGTTGTTVVVVIPALVPQQPETEHHEAAYSSR